MKIAFAIREFDNKSGIVKVVKNLVKELALIKNYEIYIVCTEIYPEELTISDNISIYNLDVKRYGRRLQYLFMFRQIDLFLNSIQPDIVVVAGMELVPFYLNRRHKSIRFFAWEHRNFEAGPLFRLEWIGKRFAIKYFEQVICISKKDELLYREYSTQNAEIIQIYNLSNVSTNKMDYNISSKKIISCGTLSRIKGFDMLIKVAKEVFAKYPDWSWDIYGEGTERQNLERAIKENDLERNVCLKGYVSDIYSKYKDYSFFVFTSRAEGMGMVLLEAQKAGLPVVSFDIKCGPSDVIINKENGFLVEPFNIEEMSKSIISLIENPKLRKLFSDRSEMNHAEFEKEVILKKWIDMIENK